MSSLAVDWHLPNAIDVSIEHNSLLVELSDGRTVSAPLEWFPRLLHGTPSERNNWRIIGQGEGIHWADLDEDISVESLLLGHTSAESQHSLKRWLASREEETIST